MASLARKRLGMRNYLFLLIVFCSSPVLAADSLGRLFLTPDQRAQLEIARAQRDRRLPIAETEGAPTAAPAPQGPDVVTYSGVVRRSDGKSTVWLNDKPVNERNRIQPEHEVSVTGLQRDGAVSVAIPQADRRASLKVGQSLEVTSGVIEESYSRRATLPRPAENASAPAPAASTAATTAATTKPVGRPLRPSDTKESDPESGAAPAVRVPGK